MSEPVEIKAELRLEDLASEILKQIRGEVEETSDEVDEAKSTWKDWAASAAQNLHNLGINIKDVAMQVADFGKSFIDAAAGGESADTALGGLISAVQGIPFAEANEQAKKFHDEMDGIAQTSGAVGNVEEAFHKLVDFTGATNEGLGRARGNISALSNISGVLGKDVNAITQEFALMQEGTIRTKGQLFQLLQSTGAFGQESKKVAAEWAKMTDEKRAAVLEGAIDKIAGKFENIPKTFNNWSTSLHNMGEIAKEQIGEPFLNALTPALEEAMAAMVELKPDILELAEMIGGEFKMLIGDATGAIREGFQYLKTHKEDVKELGETIRSAWSFAKSVAQFIFDHKEELAIAFGAKMAGDGLTSAVAMGGKLKGAFTELPGALNKSIGAINAWTVVIGAAVLAGVKLGEALTELIDVQTDQSPAVQQLAAIEAAKKAASVGRSDTVASIRETQKNLATGRGENFEEDSANRTLMSLERLAKHVRDDMDVAAERAASSLQAGMGHVGDALRKSGQDHYNASGSYADKVLEATASRVVVAYNQAIANGDMAAAAYAANMLAGSTQLQEAFLGSGATISGGIDQFASMLYNKSDLLAKGLSALGGGDKLGKGGGPTTIVNAGGTGSGSVSISVKQDFRNADPDRVAYAFQRDIKRAAENRYQASTVTPFG